MQKSRDTFPSGNVYFCTDIIWEQQSSAVAFRVICCLLFLSREILQVIAQLTEDKAALAAENEALRQRVRDLEAALLDAGGRAPSRGDTPVRFSNDEHKSRTHHGA